MFYIVIFLNTTFIINIDKLRNSLRRGKDHDHSMKDPQSDSMDAHPSDSSPVVSTIGRPDFLYSGEAKKLHKRKISKFQRRRLRFYPDRVDYFKVDSDKRSGTIPIQGVRVEVEGDNLFEFEYDDISARKYVFLCDNDLVKAQMLWIANGEQFNNHGSTYKNLKFETTEFMRKSLSYPIMRELVTRKYKKAHTYFTIEKVAVHTKRIYEDLDSVGIDRIATDSSSSESDSESNLSEKGILKRLYDQMKLSKENSFEADGTEKSLSSSVGSINDSQAKLKSMKKVPSYDLSEEDTGYMSIVDANYIDYGFKMEESPTEAMKFNLQKSQKSPRPNSKPSYVTTVQLCSDYKYIDVGAMEVNAIKARLCGDRDYIEIDVGDIGKTLKELHSVLCKEFDILTEDIVCIVKQPDVRIRNDIDVQRIRAGRMLQIETRDD